MSQSSQSNQAIEADPWGYAQKVLKQIKAPTFPNRDFNVRTYGAEGNGTTDCSQALKQAIEACHKAGGGRVVVPAGKYLSGPIYLKSNVNLHLEKGATILFSTDPNQYLPMVHTRWEGIELMNYSPLIYAFEEKNIAVTGEGTLDGQASNEHWWPWVGSQHYGTKAGQPTQKSPGNRDRLFELADNYVPVAERKFGPGYYMRPQFVQPYRCENVLIQGVTIQNSPMWVLHPVLCTNVTIQGVTVESQGPNSDGCDPESCKNVLIKDCYFNTGDDCIAIKSGRNADGRRINVPSENIIIQGCTMINGHGGVVIGSEITGGTRNVFAENCKMNSPLLDRALRIKSNSARGGLVENVYLRNIEVGQIKQQVVRVNMFYDPSEPKGNNIPVVRNIEVRNMKVQNGGDVGVLLEGYEQSPVENLRLINVEINGVKQPYKFSNVENILFENVTINGEKVTLPKETASNL
ncbi:glycoside hydrolase family 28 protein [Sabulibacter ruber]|uniref:glycoside hydrolase family 28 protein n=1 Tax=Sabulibacter ruber TaxID=2811901 RepID=UPI001A95843D|nr:glycoside hydrolase family 28 protein [Sabulibacter ruber]